MLAVDAFLFYSPLLMEAMAALHPLFTALSENFNTREGAKFSGAVLKVYSFRVIMDGCT
jgi:hypothetical protein